MAEFKKVLESKCKIRFHDCDPFNHLNNSRYIDYMVTARGDQLIDNYNFDIYKLAREQCIGWVTAQTQISYISPAYLMEEVTIKTQLIGYTDKSLLLEAEMWNSDKTRLKSVMWTRLVHFNLKTQKSISHSEELIEFFRQIENPLSVASNFEERIKNLKAIYMSFLQSVIKQFEYYKMLGEKTIARIPEERLFWQYNEESNSVGIIVKHLWGNMLSRWTDILTTDGEKEWRNREAEFQNDITSIEELINKWNEGWSVLFNTLNKLKEEDLDTIIYIRNQGHTVMEAINRQLAHYPYHIGQIVFIGKMLAGNWESLSIPKGASVQYNAEKFTKGKHRGHFTDEFLNNPDS